MDEGENTGADGATQQKRDGDMERVRECLCEARHSFNLLPAGTCSGGQVKERRQKGRGHDTGRKKERANQTDTASGCVPAAEGLFHPYLLRLSFSPYLL